MAKIKSTRTPSRKQPPKRKTAAPEWQRIAARAKKIHAKNQAREIVAQWRALKKLGYIKTTVVPSQKRLTKYRRQKIKKAFIDAQKQALLEHGKVIRALQRQVTDKGRIKYNLDKHFKIIHSKYKPSGESGIRKTLKGYIIELLSPTEKVRITKKGKVQRKDTGKRAFTIEQEFMSGKDILKLANNITSGKFTIKENQVLLVKQFGGFESDAKPYHSDSLDLFVADMNRYRNTMRPATFQAWLNLTEIRTVTMG